MKRITTAGMALALSLGILAPAGPAFAKEKDSGKKESSGFLSGLVEAAKSVADKAAGADATTISEIIKSSDSKTKAVEPKKVLVLPITGAIQERAQELVIFGSQPESLKQYIDVLRKARLDADINTVVLRLGPNQMGMATAQELREAIAKLRERNKKVVAILEDDSQASYLVATAANEIVMPPSGDILLHGISADSYFLKNLLAKVGVKVQIIHVGQYKSYGETFTQDEFTTPARQNMNEIVDGVYGQLKQMIAEGRKVSPEKAEEILNAGPLSADKAKEMGLVDKVAYADELLDGYKKNDLSVVEAEDYKSSSSSKSDSGTDLSLLSILSMMNKSSDSDDSGGDYPRVAVLYAVGSISLGSNGDSGFGSESEIASEDFIEELEKLKNNDKIRAVILRVNSPGGSAFASDLIWKKIEELKAKKPVVASMGDVAASGGYYISMGASKIVAQPGTLTGSIGVVGGKPNLENLYEKLGVNKTTISRGKYAGMFSETKDFTPQETQAVQDMMKRTYDEFVTKAAKGRSKSFDQVHEVAQGRVWTGEAAKKVGLVDELGGLDKAILETKTLIGLKPDEKVRLIAYPKEKSLVDILQKAFGASSSTVKFQGTNVALGAVLGNLPVPAGLQNVFQQALSISQMFQRENVLTVMPVMVDLK
jgi:protease-4